MNKKQWFTMSVLPTLAFILLCVGLITVSPAATVWAQVTVSPVSTTPTEIYTESAAKSVAKEKPIAATEVAMTTTSMEMDLLARLVRAEAEGEPYQGKVAVAAVVLNRVESHRFPDRIHDVVVQPRQFEPVGNGQIHRPADFASKAAVVDALQGADPSYGSLFFFAPKKANSSYLWSLPLRTIIGNHYFLGSD